MIIQRPKAAYIHIPFCMSKCWYCDFNSYAGMDSIHQDYVDALITEIRHSAPGPHTGLETVYFGGGTPTLLDTDSISRILQAIARDLGAASGAEVTIEANPGTVDADKLSTLRAGGFNRLSLGVQSLDDAFLSSIGRAHTAAQARGAYTAARRAGFGNVGIDLIFALPGQSVAQWEQTLNAALDLAPEHISLYELSIEEGTQFSKLCADGKLAPIDEDAQVTMYEMAISKLTSAGYEHYEVSNFARPGYRSRHNTVYWLNDSHFGFGAGATSYVDGVRARRVANPSQYISSIAAGTDAIESSEKLDDRARLGECMVQGLRMLDGVDVNRLRAQTGCDPLREFASQMKSLSDGGFIELTDDRIRVTHRGLLMLNDVAAEFV